MGVLRERMAADLKIGRYSEGTRKTYLRFARNFVAYHKRSPVDLGADDVRQYLLHLVEERKVGADTLGQARAALRFLYRVTLRRPLVVEWVPVPRRGIRVPVILSGTEVSALLAAVREPKYRVGLSAMYSAGLRISEACQMRIEDIDSKRGVILIQGKGSVERYTLLAARLLEELRDYYRHVRPPGPSLFPARTAAGHITKRSLGKAFGDAAKSAGIRKKVRPHTLRHSFATHLIETGVDVTVVQALLGHKSLESTEIYIRTRPEQIRRTTSPFDLLGSAAGDILG